MQTTGNTQAFVPAQQYGAKKKPAKKTKSNKKGK